MCEGISNSLWAACDPAGHCELATAPLDSFDKLLSELQIKFCSMILQFCRCGGLFDAKGNPDGFLSHFSSLRNFWLDNSLTV